MSKEIFSKLKEAAARIESKSSNEEKIQSLIQAFHLFTEETEKLTHSYEEQDQTLNKKIAQLDSITRYLHNILNSISQGILFIDLNGIITTYNGPAENLLELDALDVLFASYSKHFADTFFGFSLSQALSEQKAPETLFTTIETPSGEFKEIELHCSFVLEGPKTEQERIDIIQGLVIVLRDRTEINYLRRIANRDCRMKELGEIAASVAHEIRNPLGGIKGFASLLQRDLKDSPNLQHMADQIVSGADRLNRIVNNVLDYARPLQPQLEPHDIVALAHEIQEFITAEYDANIQIISRKPSILIAIDRELIHGALLNLVLNSIQAMPKGGRIQIELKEEFGHTIISVKDTGVGISKENLDKIFSPFFTTKTTGNGLGLAEVHKVVLAHEGTIDVQSEENKGTIFTIKIPSNTHVREKL